MPYSHTRLKQLMTILYYNSWIYPVQYKHFNGLKLVTCYANPEIEKLLNKYNFYKIYKKAFYQTFFK